MHTRNLLKNLKKTKESLKGFQKKIPNKDSYITVYCLIEDTIASLKEAIKDINPALKEANKEDKRKK